AAILAIDAVGYSRLMRDDEVRTLSDLKAVRTGVIEPATVAHNGRLFKVMGDGFLVEFGSVGSAVQCAIDIQRKVLDRNASDDAGQKLEFRMGLNVADIIPDLEDVYGDGVNIAVRLETLAKPSEICISGAVYEQIRHNFGDLFRRLGRRTLKNIDIPIEVYIARVGGHSAPTFLNRLWRLRRARRSIAAGAAAVVLFAGLSALFVTEFEWSFSFDGKSAASAAAVDPLSGSDTAKVDEQAEIARIEAGVETAAAKAKAAAVKAKAKAEANTATAEAKAKEQVVRGAVDAWKEASISLTQASKDLSEAEAKLAELNGQAAALTEAGPASADEGATTLYRNALMQRIRDAEEDLSREIVRYQASVKGEARAKALMEKIKSDAQTPKG
ncbi:MAG: adenylate/guanylate cyclase domain-containing protein, partial [Alphaproteobacteria bacterium]|nr:adenylate/guanylate cyclase domain-containing protein [Alphaproteobacteria bacterium]